jgi:hypothetical protein
VVSVEIYADAGAVFFCLNFILFYFLVMKASDPPAIGSFSALTGASFEIFLHARHGLLLVLKVL